MHLHIPDTIEYLESIQYVEIIHTILGEHTILRGHAVIQGANLKKINASQRFAVEFNIGYMHLHCNYLVVPTSLNH